MGSFSLVHWLVVLAIAVIIFGNRLPGLGKSLGEGIRNFKSGLNGNEDDTPANQPAQQQASTQTKQISTQTEKVTVQETNRQHNG